MDIEQRVKKLESDYLKGVRNSGNQALSIETLLDALIVMYDELNGSTLRREKNITDFVSWGEYTIFEADLNDKTTPKSLKLNSLDIL